MEEKPDGMAMFIRKWDDIDNIVRFFIIIYVLRYCGNVSLGSGHFVIENAKNVDCMRF
jgi:hypothetical protein